MQQFEITQENLTTEFDNISYRKPIGVHKPKFAGLPDNYYPLTTCEALAYASIVLFTVGSVLGIMLGLMNWIMTQGLDSFAQIWSVVFLLFVMVMIVAFYVGGVKRIKEEKRMIAEAHQMEEQA